MTLMVGLLLIDIGCVLVLAATVLSGRRYARSATDYAAKAARSAAEAKAIVATMEERERLAAAREFARYGYRP